MDETVLIIFTAFVLVLFFIGFFKKQVILSVFSGIGFFLIGLFVMQGVTYSTGASFVDANWTTTNMTNNFAVWHTTYGIPIFLFLSLFGISLIIISVLEYMHGKKTHPMDRVGEDDDE